MYVKEGQYTEEEILDNNESSRQFDEFLSVLGERVRLKGKHQASKAKNVSNECMNE